MDYLLENLITKTGLTLPDREAYLQDPALIYMRWAAEWETPEWMLDYDLKKEQLFGGKGTQDVWVNAHRADHLGKPGYPTSANVSAWTYAPLQELYLKDNQGGASAPLTKFKISTLEEALTVCRGRLFIVPDKPSLWQYISTTDVMKDSDPYFLFPAMQKTGNYESILISYGKPGGNFLNFTENWRRLADQGVRLIMTNDPLGMVRFAAKYHNQ